MNVSKTDADAFARVLFLFCAFPRGADYAARKFLISNRDISQIDTRTLVCGTARGKVAAESRSGLIKYINFATLPHALARTQIKLVSINHA